MRKGWGRYFLGVILSVFICACANEMTAKYKTAKQLEMKGDEKNALVIYRELCYKASEYDRKKYCGEYHRLQREIEEDLVHRVKSSIAEAKDKYGIVPMNLLDSIESEVRSYQGLIGDNKIDDLLKLISSERERTKAQIDRVISKVEELKKERKYQQAYLLLKRSLFLDPSLFEKEIEDLKKKAYRDLMSEVKRLVAEERWHFARERLEFLKELNPTKEVLSLYNELGKKDSIEYYIRLADEAKAKKDFERALKYYRLAVEQFREAKAKVLPLMQKTLMELALFYFQQGESQMEQGFMAQAYFSFKRAMEYLNQLPVEQRGLVLRSVTGLNRYYDSLYVKAKKYEDEGKFGVAYFFYLMIHDLNPVYPGIKKDLTRVEKMLGDRAIKKLAVLTFKSPKYAPDAGSLITSGIIIKLHDYLRGDVNLIEREALAELMKEMELKLAASQGRGPTESIKLTGADYFVIGEALDYKVDTIEQTSKKTVRVKTGVERVPNPEYNRWLAVAEKMRMRGETPPPAPPRYIEKPVYNFISYTVKYIRKVGIVSASYRVVDVEGDVLYTGSAESKKVFSDESTEGVEVGDFKVPFKVANLPTDSEILRKAREEVVEKIARSIQKLFAHSEKKYLDRAEQFQNQGNYQQAVENYANALVIMKIKGLPFKSVEEKAIKLLDLVEM